MMEALAEKEKYERMWTIPEYRKVSPGEIAANTFMSIAKPTTGEEVTDFGAGTGRGSLRLWWAGGLKVTMLDFATNCLDAGLASATREYPDQICFVEHDLTEPMKQKTRYGYCTDVMEHIPTEDVDKVLDNILAGAESVFFRISTGPDVMGPRYLNQPLHLTVKDYAWWAEKFTARNCDVLYSDDLGIAVDFYVTNGATGSG